MRPFLVVLALLTALVIPFPTGMSRFEAPPTVAQRATVLGYSRAAFGEGWQKLDDGCTTRTTAMARAFSAESCRTPHRDWSVDPITDPYTGKALVPGDVEIDHVVPLSAAWDLGAHAWPEERRRAFANDPRNLVVTSSRANQSKSDQLPGEWMPPQRRARCAYARQLVAVAREYQLPLPRQDLRASRLVCSGVSGLVARRSLVVPRELNPGSTAAVP
ncbi:HNH endonuclease family protein [Corynebacterium sp. UBA2622]|uniref:HNH endonuclease family protein n=1 Tax=Corynebacterium sp. UBA2622 TaxID=1946393 RepID=UPI0025BDE4C6|nr:HNH endonuclease family protein [Corynebacterium sp. UBA2622]